LDFNKLNDRVVKQIKTSLKAQRLSKEIEPIKLLEKRDRYHLVQCRMNGNEEKLHRLLFLRYDVWFFCIFGLHSMPSEIERREYNNSTRVNPEKEKEQAQTQRTKEQQEAQVEKGLEAAMQRVRKRTE
jgi:hypothetical protein